MSQSNDHRICFVGDSFVQGTGDPTYLGWTGRVARMACDAGYSITHYNLGVRRDTSREISTRWNYECEHRLRGNIHPYVVFSFGVNDTALEYGSQRVALTETCTHFRRMLVQSVGHYETLAIGPPPVQDALHNQRIKSLCDALQETAAMIDVSYLSVFDVLWSDQSWMSEVGQSDGCHPNECGYKKLADLVGTWSQWWFHLSA